MAESPFSRLAQIKNIAKADITIEKAKIVSDDAYKQFLNPTDKTPPKKIYPKTPLVMNEDVEDVDLRQLLKMSLSTYYKIMKHTPLDPNDTENYIANAKLALAAANSVTTAQIKVDENQLKARKQDDILTVLKALKDEEAKQAKKELLLEALAE